MGQHGDIPLSKYSSSVLAELGARPWINARNWSSNIGGNTLDLRVIEAMNEVSQVFVDMHELVEKADAKIASLCQADEAHLTTGAGRAIELAVAGCMARDDFGRWSQLPSTTNFPNEVVIHRGHYINYTPQWRATGAELIEYGVSGTLGSSKQELEACINDNTCCIAYTFSYNNVPRGVLPFDEVVDVAKKYSLPVVVDAASELPPIENLWKFLDLGSHIVCFSGGKAIKAPNNTGFMIGRGMGVEIIRAVREHAFPHYGCDRGSKVSKEQIVGLIRALEIFRKEGNDGYATQLELAKKIEQSLRDIPGLEVSLVANDSSSYEHIMMSHVPRVLLQWNLEQVGKTAMDLDNWMASNEPPIFLRNIHYHNYYSSAEWRMIDTFFIGPSEATIILDRIKGFFK